MIQRYSLPVLKIRKKTEANSERHTKFTIFAQILTPHAEYAVT